MIKNNFIFSTKDFDNINWHDFKIHGFAFDEVEFKFYLDIDLIIEWIEPLSNEDGYRFKIAPATIIFMNVWNVVFDIDTNLALDIDNVSMQNPKSPKNKDQIQDNTEYDWKIGLHQGEISFKSIGFEIYIRKSPEIRKEQSLLIKERGGVSFAMEDID
ncbi:MAG: hypothetical protein ACM3PX_09615 [Omnitrophica WOR_2 bacterium]|jgi:hypothetical protein